MAFGISLPVRTEYVLPGLKEHLFMCSRYQAAGILQYFVFTYSPLFGVSQLETRALRLTNSSSPAASVTSLSQVPQ